MSAAQNAGKMPALQGEENFFLLMMQPPERVELGDIPPREYIFIDVEPLSIPDVLAVRPVILYGKWKGKPQGTITLNGYSGEGAYRQTFNVGDIAPQESNSALRYLWARKRIELPGDYNKLEKSDERVREITSLGLTYNLLTAYTSFVAVDREIRRTDDSLKSVKQPLPLSKGVSELAVGGGVRNVPEPEMPFLLIGANSKEE